MRCCDLSSRVYHVYHNIRAVNHSIFTFNTSTNFESRYVASIAYIFVIMWALITVRGTIIMIIKDLNDLNDLITREWCVSLDALSPGIKFGKKYYRILRFTVGLYRTVPQT